MYKYSRGKIIEVDTESWEAELVQAFHPPDDLLSKSQGSTQILPNGNAFVNWGSEGAVTEFKSDGTPIFHAYMDSGALGKGVQNYRGFRYNWTGIPNEEPAIAVLRDEETESTNVYVSWNGDTLTRAWRFYEIRNGRKRSYLGEAKRKSFETIFSLDRDVAKAVQAEAVDAFGEILRVTSAARPEPLVHEFKADEKKSGKERPVYEGVGSWFKFKGQKFLMGN